jgi:hypothetical protein
MKTAKVTWAFQHPLKYIEGKKCKRCGKPAVCAVITISVMPACLSCGQEGAKRGYDVVFRPAAQPPAPAGGDSTAPKCGYCGGRRHEPYDDHFNA